MADEVYSIRQANGTYPLQYHSNTVSSDYGIDNRSKPTDTMSHDQLQVITTAAGHHKLQLSYTVIDNVKTHRHVDATGGRSEHPAHDNGSSVGHDNQAAHVLVNPVSLRKLPQVITPQPVGKGGGNAMPDDGSGLKKLWRVERFQLQPVDERSYGVFFSGDSYIIQYYSHAKGMYLYYWLGAHSSVDERGTAALKTIELDDQLGGMATHVRIVQGEEPPHFLAMFDGFIVILDGGYPSGFQQVHEAEANRKSNEEAHGKPNGEMNIRDNHLLHVRAASVAAGNDPAAAKDMKFGRAIEVEFRARSLNSNDVFVVTTKARLACVWYGRGSSRAERAFAHDVCQRLATGGPQAHTQWTVNERPVVEGEEEDWFWEALGGCEKYADDKRLQQPPVEESDSDIPHEPPQLFHCSNASGKFAVEEVHGEFSQASLISDDVMLLDTNDALWIWIGARANREERYHSEQSAKEYLKHEQAARCGEKQQANDVSDANEVCVKLPLYTIKQGCEPVNFCGFFGAWDAKVVEREVGASWSAPKLEKSKPEIVVFNDVNWHDKNPTLEVPQQSETHQSTPLSPSGYRSPSPGSPMLPVGPMPKRDSLDKQQFVDYELLRNKLTEELPFGVDPRCKEIYLEDKEFAQVFDGLAYDAFQRLPKWRQLSMKKSAGLF